MLRAQSVMWQPVDSLPHDDHIHMRIACSVEETQAGCSGGGPYWEWLPTLPTSVPLDDPRLASLVADEEPLPPIELTLTTALLAASLPAPGEPTAGGPAASGTDPSVVSE